MINPVCGAAGIQRSVIFPVQSGRGLTCRPEAPDGPQTSRYGSWTEYLFSTVPYVLSWAHDWWVRLETAMPPRLAGGTQGSEAKLPSVLGV